jgi:hypothetical protein
MTDRVEDKRGILECKNTKIAASNRDVIHKKLKGIIKIPKKCILQSNSDVEQLITTYDTRSTLSVDVSHGGCV